MKSTTHLTLNINRIGERFPNEETMIRWISACLNCNTNHAVVEVEKFSPQTAVAESVAKIDAAFEALNKLLDVTGGLESEALQRAVYQLRLEIAQASGDKDRVAAAQDSLQDLTPAQATGVDQSALADEAYAQYDFGPTLVVTDASGWEYTTPGHERTRTVFVERLAGLETENPSWQLQFTVAFDPETGLVREVYALDRNGQPVGKMPA